MIDSLIDSLMDRKDNTKLDCKQDFR